VNYLFKNKAEVSNFYFDYVNVIYAIRYFYVTGMSYFTALPFKNQEEMLQFLTLRRNYSIMDFVLAGVAFDDSIPFPENIQVRKSVVKNCHIILSDIRPYIHLRVI